jgi:hypothetical protein
MSIIQMIGLVVFIVALAGVLGYLFQSPKDKSSHDIEPVQPYTKEELDNIKLAEELYNKDLRPVVAKKAKTKPAPELQVVEAEFVAKVVETSKVFPPQATVNAQAINEVKETKSQFPIDKPKKKRKYYPKAKK